MCIIQLVIINTTTCNTIFEILTALCTGKCCHTSAVRETGDSHLVCIYKRISPQIFDPLNIVLQLNVQKVPVKEVQTLLAAVSAGTVVNGNLYNTFICPPLVALRNAFPGIHNCTCIWTAIHTYKNRIFLGRIQIQRPDYLCRKHITVNLN